MNEPLVVVLQRRATREIEDVDAWWRQNRPASPDLFLAELESMLAATALMPALGAAIRGERVPGLRRVLLRRTKYHVYYRVSGETLEVLAVWHAARGAGPGL
ncbi:MAG: type II toxin-antitoxin system RelE/ParE family toxin [Polyangiaceae bacterium]|jgi:plasmid stabilization system protein ParE